MQKIPKVLCWIVTIPMRYAIECQYNFWFCTPGCFEQRPYWVWRCRCWTAISWGIIAWRSNFWLCTCSVGNGTTSRLKKSQCSQVLVHICFMTSSLCMFLHSPNTYVPKLAFMNLFLWAKFAAVGGVIITLFQLWSKLWIV